MGCSCRGSSSPASLHTSTPFSPQSPKKAQQKKKEKESYATAQPPRVTGWFMKHHIIENPSLRTLCSPHGREAAHKDPPQVTLQGQTCGTLVTLSQEMKSPNLLQHQESCSKLYLRAQPELIPETFLPQARVLLLAMLTQGLCWPLMHYFLASSRSFSSPGSPR